MCAVILERVLGGQHKEWLRERVCVVIDRYLEVVHRLQEARLRLGGCSIDFVGQDDVREDRALLELELTLPGIVDRHAEDIGRKQIAGKLDPLEAAAQRSGEGLGKRGLADSRDVLYQEVSPSQQRDDGEAYRLRLPEEDLLDVRLQSSDLFDGILHHVIATAACEMGELRCVVMS